MPRSADSRRLDADLPTPVEVEALIRVCSRRAPTGIRNRAMIALAWRSGLRIGEVLALKPKDIDLDGGTVTVQHSKGDKRRVVGREAGTAALTAQWLEVGEQRGHRGRANRVCTVQGAPTGQADARH